MATWIAVGIIFVVGGFAHYANLDTRITFAACIAVLLVGLGADWAMMG